MSAEHTNAEQYVIGRRAVAEALAAGAALEKIFLSYGAEDAGPLASIRAAAKRSSVTCSVMDRRKFADLEASLGAARNDAQGVIALRAARATLSLDALLDQALAVRQDPILVALDGITDPHNLGAIARSAECAGASGLILSAKFTAPVTPVAVKASAGALEVLAMTRVQRIAEALDHARSRGFRVVGTAMPATATYDADVYRGPVIIVIGSEGEGLHPRVIASCDVTVEIPMRGNVASLNASVAAGIVLFEAASHRPLQSSSAPAA